MESEYELSSRLPDGIPFEWETAPGRAISETADPALNLTSITCLRPPPGSSRVQKPANFATLPVFNGFDPAPSGHLVADKLFKRFVKLRRRSSKRTQCCAIDDFQSVLDQSKRFALENIMEAYNYDSDENGGNSASSSDGPFTPCSSISASSSRSSSSQPPSGNTTKSCTPSTPCLSHQPGSQLMATMLLSLFQVDDDDIADDERGCTDVHCSSGPHESAWHQPDHEVLANWSRTGRHASVKQSSNVTKGCSTDLEGSASTRASRQRGILPKPDKGLGRCRGIDG